jgi:hypothetical protein
MVKPWAALVDMRVSREQRSGEGDCGDVLGITPLQSRR